MLKHSLCAGLQTCIGQIWNKAGYTDFNVVVEDVEFQCHRFILASCSTFFSLMLRNDMSENLSNKAVLKNISKETFRTILNAIYLGEFDLTLDNVENVWQAVDMLDIKYLTKDCEDFISDNLTVENYEGILYHGKLLNHAKILQITHSFILKNFDHFKTTDTFHRMSIDEVVSLVRDYNLNVSSENSVIDAILEWIFFKSNCNALGETINNLNPSKSEDEYDEASKCKKGKITGESDQKDESKPIVTPLTTLLSAARLCFVSEDYVKNLLTCPLITSDESAMNLVRNAIKCLWKPNCPTSNLVPFRKCHGLCNAVAFISKKKPMFYVLEEKRIVTPNSLPKLHSLVYNTPAIAGDQDILILIEKSRREVSYHLFRETYSELDKLIKIRPTENSKTICLCYRRNIILVSNSPETLQNIEKTPRCTLNVLAVPISKKHTPKLAVGYKDNIVIFTNMHTRNKNVVHVVKLDMSHRFEPIPFDLSLANMVSFHSQGNTYVLNAEGDLWLVGETETSLVKVEHTAKLWNTNWTLHGAVCYLGTLFLFGTSDSLTFTHTSLPNIFDNIEIVTNSYSYRTVSLVVPKRNLSL